MQIIQLLLEKRQTIYIGSLLVLCLIMVFGSETLAPKIVAVVGGVAGTLAYIDGPISRERLLYVIPLLFSVWIVDAFVRGGIDATIPYVFITILSIIFVELVKRYIIRNYTSESNLKNP